MANEYNEEADEVIDDTTTETTTENEVVPEVKPQETPEAKRARLTRQLEQLDKKYPTETFETRKPSQKSNDLDYGQKAYLTANGIKGAKEFEFVKAELKASGEELDNLLENDYFKSKLEKFRALSQTVEATPTGKRSSGVATDSVEYWMTKPFEEVPHDMRAKVVNAKLQKEQSKGVFYNS